MRRKARRVVAAGLMATALTSSTGCDALGMQDWQRDILSALVGGIGSYLAVQSTQVTVERECFENGVQVDCDTLPQAQP